jgi:intracellular sulfur oxidation DsrE/DsrF family protein
MKRILFSFLLATLACGLSVAQEQPYRVVFDLTSTDTLNQMALTRMISAISDASPKAEMEVVMYGKGFELVMPEKSKFTNDVKDAIDNRNVSFKVCEMAMKKQSVDKSMFVDGVQTVPDGIYEIVKKQGEGWAYVKAIR